MVQMWADVFGAEALTVRRFDRTLLQGGDLVRDFCPLLNLDPDQFDSVPPKNESIGLAPLLFLRRLNQDLPRIKDGAFNKERGNIVAVLRAYPDDRRFTLPPATAQQIRDHFADSYDALKQDHFAETDGPLFPSASADAQPAASDLTEDDIMNIARHLWVNRRTKFT